MAHIGFRNEKDLARFLSTLGHDLFKAATKAELFDYGDLLRSFSLGKAGMVFIERMAGIEDLTEATSVALKTSAMAAWWAAVKHTQAELSVDEDQLRSEIASLPDLPIEALDLTKPAANDLAKGLRQLVNKHCQDLDDPLRRRILARWDNLFPLELYTLLEVRNLVFKPLNDELAKKSYQEQRKLFARETHRRQIIAKYHQRVMDNPFGMTLADIYQPPAFAIHRNCVQRDSKKMFVTLPEVSEDLHHALLQLLAGHTLAEQVQWSRIALLLGGPGQGKSSFCKRLAVDVLDRFADRPVYTVLLRHLRDFVDLPRNPLKILQADVDHHYPGDAAPDFHRSLLILDGLDELVMRGDFRQEQVETFLRELDRQCEDQGDLRVFMTSRYGVTQPDEWPARDVLVLQLQPFDLARQQRWLGAYRAFDEGSTLDEARLKAIHDDKQAEHLRELLGQPILLYMVAQSHIDLSADTSRASIYDQLFTTLIERKWDKGQLEATRIWQDKSNIRRALQDVAMAIFQTGETFASREDLEGALREKTWWRRLSEQDWRNPLDGLMVAFYLQEENQKDRYAVEFLHKSLMEYLVSEKILYLLNRNFQAESDDSADDQLKKLNYWFGKSFLPFEVQVYFAENVAELEEKCRKQLAESMAIYLDRFLVRQFLSDYSHPKPLNVALFTFHGYWQCMQRLHPVNRFTEENRESLFGIMGHVNTLRHQNDLFGMMGYVASHRGQSLDMRNQHLGPVQSLQFNFSLDKIGGSKFIDARLPNSTFFQSFQLSMRKFDCVRPGEKERVEFTSSFLPFSLFFRNRTNLLNFPKSMVTSASFYYCDLSKADFSEAILRDTCFFGSILRFANFQNADLRGASFHRVRGWEEIKSICSANIAGIRDAPEGFREWALENGAVEDAKEPLNTIRSLPLETIDIFPNATNE